MPRIVETVDDKATLALARLEEAMKCLHLDGAVMAHVRFAAQHVRDIQNAIKPVL